MRSLARLITAALALTVATFGLAAPANAAAGFGDVEANRWYTDPIAWLVSEGITNGTSPGCFSPHEQVTRGQIVTFMYRLDQARGNEPLSTDHPFTDIVSGYQNEPIGWAFSAGVTTGTSPTTFAPDAGVTRGDFAVLLWRYAGEPSSAAGHPFADVTRGYQNGAISWMAQTGITTGTSATTFSPEGNMTRAEAATFFFRFMDQPGVASVASSASCLAHYEKLLTDSGTTAEEARCIAPFLVTFELDYLLEVITKVQPYDEALIKTLSDVISAGCVATDRSAELIRIFL